MTSLSPQYAQSAVRTSHTSQARARGAPALVVAGVYQAVASLAVLRAGLCLRSCVLWQLRLLRPFVAPTPKHRVEEGLLARRNRIAPLARVRALVWLGISDLTLPRRSAVCASMGDDYAAGWNMEEASYLYAAEEERTTKQKIKDYWCVAPCRRGITLLDTHALPAPTVSMTVSSWCLSSSTSLPTLPSSWTASSRTPHRRPAL